MKKLCSILLFPLTLLRLILLIMTSLLFMCTVIIEDKISHKKGSFKFWTARNWGKTILIILGIFVKKNQLPKINKYIVMPNHRSYIDTFILAAYSPSAFVAKAELLKWPIIGTALKSGRAIMVQRNELKSLLSTMDKIKKSIDNDISITIFPEGTTSPGPGILPFKKGTFKLAADLKIPIIPCALVYRDINHAWYGDDSFVAHFFRQLWKPISIVDLHFSAPIQSDDHIDLLEKTKDSIESMLNSIQNKQ